MDEINLVQVEKLRRTSARHLVLLEILIEPYEALWDVGDFDGKRTGLNAFNEVFAHLIFMATSVTAR